MRTTTVHQKYLKGKSVFLVSLLVVGITFLTVWISGINYNRDITSNLYLSLSIIGTILFLFMSYGLYSGIGLTDNFPNYRQYKRGDFLSYPTPDADISGADAGEGIAGIIVSILLWIVMTVAMILLFVLLEAVFWISLSIILTMLYWVFFRALKLVFSKSGITRGNLPNSLLYSLAYTTLYLGWIYGIVYLTQIF